MNLPATLQTEGVGNIITNSGGAYYTQTKGNNILDAKINPNNYNEDKEYDNNAKDPLRGTDAKNKERKQVDDSLGKRGSKEREQQSGELHDSKKGGRNDNNKAWGDLKNGNYWFELDDKIPLIIPVLKESATKIAAVVEAKVSPIVIPKSLIDIWTRSIPGYKPKDLV